MGLAAMILLLLAWNNLLNLWRPFNGWLYVPLNLTLAAALVGIGFGGFGLDGATLGFSGVTGRHLLLGAVLGIAAVAPLFAIAGTRWGAPKVADKRVAHLDRRGAAYQVLVRIPLGTALLEEVAFRGVLYGALLQQGTVTAAAVSSAVFGLWHIGPTRNLVRANRPGADRKTTVIAVVLSVLGTSLAGLFFVWLRASTGNIAAPFALHASLNSLATLAAFRATQCNKLRKT
jgi:membrane protease YdiL (CAAX protease family)